MDVERRSNERSLQARRGIHPGLHFYHQQRKNFILRVYILLMSFIALTCSQWLIIRTNEYFLEFFRARVYIALLASLGSLMLLTVLVFFPEVRFSQPFNWIVGFLIVELTTFGLMQPVLDSSLDYLVTCFLLTAVVMITFSYIGFLIPRDLTIDMAVLTGVSCILFLVLSVCLIVVVAADLYFPSLVIIGMMVVLLVMYIMYDAQLIAGDRSSLLRWNDYIVAALLVYFNFMVIFSLILFVTNTLKIDDFTNIL